MNRRVLPLVVGSLILTVGCRGSDDPTGPEIVDRPFCSGQPVTAVGVVLIERYRRGVK
jgi:hypothetical protein